MNEKLKEFAVKFEAKVCIDLATGCWNWQGCLLNNGYGQIYVGGKMLLAHRVSYALYRGEGLLQGDSLVCHTCDNRRCVNPEHLWLGTHYDNTLDSFIKGRQKVSRANLQMGPKSTRLFNAEDIAKIRSNKFTVKQLCDIYGVHNKTIHKILKRETYKEFP